MKDTRSEISTTYFPDLIADNTLFALEISGGLHYRKTGKPVSSAERERCVVAISLIFIGFEGMINRLIYFLSDRNDPLNQYNNLLNERNPSKRLVGLLGTGKISSQLVYKFREAYVIRNALAHGHLYQTGRTADRKITSINKLVLDDKNKDYIHFVNTRTLRTTNMHLHALPSEIGISDLYQVLKLWNKIYLRLRILHKEDAYLQSYTFPDYSTHLKLKGLDDRLSRLEDKLYGLDDASCTELLDLFVNDI